jgi:hypothetical protein
MHLLCFLCDTKKPSMDKLYCYVCQTDCRLDKLAPSLDEFDTGGSKEGLLNVSLKIHVSHLKSKKDDLDDGGPPDLAEEKPAEVFYEIRMAHPQTHCQNESS